MRFLIVNTDYGDFVRSLYDGRPGLADESYAVQLQARNDSLFGVADFYSTNLRALGHEADEVHANIEPLQRAWAAEHGVRVPAESAFSQRAVRRLRRLAGARPQAGWLERILAAQVRAARPDVLLVHDMLSIDPAFLRRVKPYAGVVVGQHAAVPIPHADEALRVYDLVLSSFPPTVAEFERRGIPAALHRLAFEPRVLAAVPAVPRRPVVSFVGSLVPGIHASRIELLEAVAEELGGAFELWTRSVQHLPADSPLRARHRGAAYGIEMYRVLRESTVTLNEHGSIAPHANNLRLYEATGVGTLLVTDWKPDLAELFDTEREVVAYRSADECIELVRRHLAEDGERESITRAGQQRTLRDHTYLQRMEDLVSIVEPLVARQRVA